MNISKLNLRLWSSLVPSGGRLTHSRVADLVCAALPASLLLFGGSAQAAFTPCNVLVNPGAETGDLTGWNRSLTGCIYVVSTNDVINGEGSSNIFVHSGKYEFETFNLTTNRTYLYQDYAAAAGSQWSASVWAICYAAYYFEPGASALMWVAFYDTNNNVIPSTNSYSGTAGTCGTGLLVPGYFPAPEPWEIVPPPAVDATGWMYLIPTNFYRFDPTAAGGVYWIYDGPPFSPITTNLTAPAGTAYVRYQLEFDNTGTGGGAVFWDDCVLEKLNQTDPDITNPQPASVTIYPGGSASFTVHAVKQLKSEVLTYQWQKNGTNLPPGGGVGHIVGATTNATLSLANCDCADAGSYTCVVSDSAGSITTVPATLTVLAIEPIVNASVLGNSGFEIAPLWRPWNIFNGCYLVCATNVYDDTTNTVNVFDGNWCAEVGNNGDRDNGFWQTVPAAPGTVWKAGGWAYISSFNDFVGGNTCCIQVWFKDALGNTLGPVYESFKIYGTGYPCPVPTNQLPRDQWCYLPVTNMVNNAGIGCGDDLPTNTLPNGCFVVPAAAAYINFQVYEYCPVLSDGLGYVGVASDALYWDDMELIQVVPPAAFTASLGGTNIDLSFGAGAGLIYSVLYKTNLSDATWGVLTNVAAPMWWQTTAYNCDTNPYAINYFPITVSDPITAQSRFYQLQVQ